MESRNIKLSVAKKLIQQFTKELMKELKSNSEKESVKKKHTIKKKKTTSKQKKNTTKIPKPKKERIPVPIIENLSESAQIRRNEANLKVLARNGY